MKKKIYYVIEKELRDVEGFEETTGRKCVTVYYIVNNVPVKFFDIDIQIDENTVDQIDEYLIDNGHGDEEFEFIQL